jgi:hypothetical protein
MANAWSELSWSQGNFGQQNNITVPVTSVVDSPLSWNAGSFGYPSLWGGTFNNVGISLGDETTAGEINEGWGRLTWSENAWGGTGDVILEGLGLNLSLGEESIKIDVSPILIGLQLNTNLNSVQEIITVDVFLNNNNLLLGTSIGQVDPAPDAILTGQQVNITTGNVLAYNRQGWGRYYWGEEEWGDSGLWEEVQLTGTNLGLTVDSGVREYWGENDWGSLNTEWGGTYITETDISVIVQPEAIAPVGWGIVGWGQQGWNDSKVNLAMTIAEGEVDPSPDANVVGIGMTVSLAVGTVVIGTANVGVTGERINISQGTAEGIPNTIASPTGFRLNLSLNDVFAGATAEIDVTGNRLTISLNSINNQIWTEINTGTDATWTRVDTAA